jgi:CheY-like chemotaxis protein
MPQRVLIVDDRDELRLLLGQAIAAAEPGLELVQAADGAQALAAIAKQSVDLVVTDLDMPVMNGLELIRRLRSTPPTPPIVVISGASTDWLASQGEDELRDLPFLRKPLVLEELVRIVREQLSR